MDLPSHLVAAAAGALAGATLSETTEPLVRTIGSLVLMHDIVTAW